MIITFPTFLGTWNNILWNFCILRTEFWIYVTYEIRLRRVRMIYSRGYELFDLISNDLFFYFTKGQEVRNKYFITIWILLGMQYDLCSIFPNNLQQRMRLIQLFSPFSRINIQITNDIFIYRLILLLSYF